MAAGWAAVVLAVLLLAGCHRGAPAGTVEIQFWAMGAEAESVQPLITEFEAEHPGIRVRVQAQPWSSAHEKFLTAYAGRSTPDVAQLGNTWVAELNALHALRDLTPDVAASAVVDSADYFHGVWDTNVVDGRLWGVPWYVDTRLLFYRKDILREAGYDAVPDTWAGWTEALRAVKQEVGPGRYAVLLPLNEFEPPLILALNTGDLLRDDGRYGNFRSPGFRKAFEFYVSLFRDGLAPPATANEISNVYQEFGRGYFTFYISGPWNISEFKKRLPADVEWGAAPMPGPTPGVPGVSIAGGSSLVVFERSEHPAEAWALVEFLSRPSVQIRFNEMTGDLPARESAWEHSGLASDPYAAVFREQLRHVRPTPKVPEQERLAQSIREVAEKVVRGQLTVDEALVELDRRADRTLAKRRQLLAPS